MARLGRNAALGLGVESTEGTAVAAALWARLAALNISKSRPMVARPDLGVGSTGFLRRRHNEVEDVTWSATVVVQYQGMAIGLMLRAIIGGTWAAPSGSGPYTHDLSPGNSPPPLTLRSYRDNGDAGDIVAGARVTRATISVSTPGVMTIALEGIAMTATTGGSAPTPSIAADQDPVLHHEGGTLSWNGSTYTVRSFSLVIDNAVEGLRSFGNRGIASAMVTGVRSVRATIGRYKTDDDWVDGQVANTEADAEITWTDGTSSLTIDLNSAVIVEPVAIENSTVGLVEESAVFEPRDDGTDQPIEFTLVNGDATAEAS